MAKHAILIAGGGTGGHIYPGLALAAEIGRRRPTLPIHWVGTRAGLEARIVRNAGYPLHFIHSAGIAGKPWARRLAAALLVPVGAVQSAGIVWRTGARVVIGVGGYASGPVVLAARVLRCSTAILEQNAQPGATNRILAPLVDRVAVAFAVTATHLSGRTVVTGNPVREGFDSQPDTRRGNHLSVLVVGGSRGARGLNRVVTEMLPVLAASDLTCRVVHQTGAADEAIVRAAHAASGIDSDVVPYIEDMAAAYAGADLVICRAGATTIAELSAAGRAAVLVPFPQATGGHQADNGRQLVRQGAAVMIEEAETGHDRLAQIVLDLLADPVRRRRMEERAQALGAPHAAAAVADLVLDLFDQPRRRGVADESSPS